MRPVLIVKDLRKYYDVQGNVTKAVDGISFDVMPGEYIGIMGASGSGKTTLLNCISTIDHATEGMVLVEDNDITKFDEIKLAKFRRESLGFIFQDFNLLDTLNGRDNIALALTILGEKPEMIYKRTEQAAKDLEIEGILDKFPYEMSGGQQQRIACARAIVTNPSLILADEPTGALDSKSAGMLLQSFRMMNEKKGATILMVTHDAFTASHCKRILFIKDGHVFKELLREDRTRKEFFDEIMNVISILGGDAGDAL